MLKRQFGLKRWRAPRHISYGQQAAGPHAEKTDTLRQRNAFQALAGRLANLRAFADMRGQGEVPRHGAKIGIAQLDSHGLADISLALEVISQTQAQRGKNLRKFIAVLPGMQIALKSVLAADRLGFRIHH